MFTHKDGVDFTIVVAYVDDLLITSSNEEIIVVLKQNLHDAFTIKDLGSLEYFLGIEVARTIDGILLQSTQVHS